MPLILGLTGTFGSGKSTVAAMLAEQGAEIIDADAIAHRLVEPGRTALAEVVGAFGRELLDESGELRRAELAKLVFGDREALRRLEGIIHPRVREEIVGRLEEVKGKTLVALDVPLLFEAGMEGMTDRTVIVTIVENQRFLRLRRREFSEREIIVRLGMQMAQARKKELVGEIIDNSGTFETTREHTQTLLNKLLGETLKEP